MNGTLRQRIPHKGWQEKQAERLLTMLGMPDAPTSFLEEISRRYRSYTKWADEQGISLPEAEIWTRWLTPELPPELIVPQAVELMLTFRSEKGPHILKSGATAVIAELKQRGYRLGVISNTTSTVELPRFIKKWGLQMYFEVVILSSLCGFRKPNPEIFWQATGALHIDPVRCAYVGNKIHSDVIGAHRAGFCLTMIIEPSTGSFRNEMDQLERPDLLFHDLVDLLEVFPPRSKNSSLS